MRGEFSINFVDDQSIRWEHLGTDSQHNAWDPMSEDVVVRALGMILDTGNYPLMIMCNLGRHRTGTAGSNGGVRVHRAGSEDGADASALEPRCGHDGRQARWWAACASCSTGT